MSQIYTLFCMVRPCTSDAGVSMDGPFVLRSYGAAIDKAFKLIEDELYDRFSLEFDEEAEDFGINLSDFAADLEEGVTKEEYQRLFASLCTEQKETIVRWYYNLVSDDVTEAFFEIESHESELLESFVEFLDKRIDQEVNGGAALSETVSRTGLNEALTAFGAAGGG